jgi:hypothetical protein
MIFVPRLVCLDDPDGKRVIFPAGYVFDRSQVEPIPGRALPLEAPEPAPIDGESHAHF